MARQLHSGPAAAAITLVVSAAGFAFLILALLPTAALSLQHPLAIPKLGAHILNLSRATGMVLLLGYISGVVVWTVIYGMRRDGMHRLIALRSGKR